MREIKFRAIGISGNVHYGNLSIIKTDFNGIKAGSYISNDAGRPFAFIVRPETVGQFIRNDQYGKEIYEGDLFMNGESIRIIEMNRGNTQAITPKRTESILLSFIIKSNPKNKVIGNIHQNPELFQ